MGYTWILAAWGGAPSASLLKAWEVTHRLALHLGERSRMPPLQNPRHPHQAQPPGRLQPVSGQRTTSPLPQYMQSAWDFAGGAPPNTASQPTPPNTACWLEGKQAESLSHEIWWGGVSHLGGGGRKARMHKAGAPGEGGREQRQPQGSGRGKGGRRRVEARKTAASQQPCLIRVCCRAWPDPWRMWECERGGWGGPGDLLPVPNGGRGAGWLPHSLLSAPQISLRWESFFQPLTDNLDS